MSRSLSIMSVHLFFAPALALLLGLKLQPAEGAVQVGQQADRWLLENKQLLVSLSAQEGLIAVRHKAGGQLWTQAPQPGPRPRFRNLRTFGDPAAGIAFDATFDGSIGLTVKLSVPQDGADLFVEADMADRSTSIDTLPFLDGFVLDSPAAALVIADYCNGHLYPLSLRPFPRTWFSLWGIDMPFAGVCNLEKGFGYAIIVQTPDDAFIRMRTAKSNNMELLVPQVGWTASMGQFRYPRRFFYHFATDGGYVALAKRYRAYARELGLIVTLAEKAARNPNVRRLFGAVDVWGDASLQFARAAKAAGVEKMIIHGRASPADMKAINELGYLTSEYDNYTDIMQVEPGKQVDAHHGQLPDDVVLKADGQRMNAWLTWDKKQYMKRCPALWTRTARLVIPPVLQQRPFLGRFIDVTTAEDLYECYDQRHRLARSDKLKCSQELLGYVRSLGLVVGGEHGRCWAVPYLDYIEGMMSGGSYSWPAGHLLRPKSKDQTFEHPGGYKYPAWDAYEKWGIGHQFRVPLWELVFHDCIVSTWYWGDSSDFLLQAAPEITPKKDAFNVLYGTIPLLWANRQGSWQTDREVFLRTCRNTCKLHEVLAAAEMLSHEFLTHDRHVQRTRFSDGTEVIVNFGDVPFQANVRGKAYVLPQNGFVASGPNIEQSLSLVGSKRVTRIRAGSFEYSQSE